MRVFIWAVFAFFSLIANSTILREGVFQGEDRPLVAEGATLTLPAFDGRAITLEIGSASSNAGLVAYSARTAGLSLSNASVVVTPAGCFVRVKEPVTGNILFFRYIDGEWHVQEERSRNGGICGNVMADIVSPSGGCLARSVKAAALTGNPKLDGAALMAKGERVLNEIDVLLAVDSSAAKWIREKTNYGAMPGVDAIALFASETIARCNATYANTGLNAFFKFKLAGYMEVAADFSRLRDRYGYVDSGSILEQLAGRRTVQTAFRSAVSAIRAKREACCADIVSCLVSCGQDDAAGVVGVSYSLDNDMIRYASMGDVAYNVCLVEAVAADSTLAHEIGHNMGAGHAKMRSASESGPQLYDYSSGYYFTVVDKKVALHGATVMGYNTDGWEDDFAYAERWGKAPDNAWDPDSWNSGLHTIFDYFSSARHTFKYVDATGSEIDTGVPLGDAKHDNTRLLSLTYPLVANYRVRGSAKPLSGNWGRARKLSAVLVSEGIPAVRLDLKVGKANAKTRKVKVSGSMIDLSAKKMKLTASSAVVANDAVALSLTVRGSSVPLVVSISGSGLVSAKWGTAALANLSCGGALSSSVHAVTVASSFTLLPGERRDLLPVGRNEVFAATTARWTFPPAARVRYNKKTGQIAVDTAGGKTNLSAMKLSYKSTTGVFKGAFKVYALTAGKMKKYRVAISGLVAGGKGYGRATCKNPASGPWSVEVK